MKGEIAVRSSKDDLEDKCEIIIRASSRAAPSRSDAGIKDLSLHQRGGHGDYG
jgi:hypothetical protein